MNTFSASRLTPAIVLIAALSFSLAVGCASAQSESDVANLKPIPSGPGIQICEPVASDGDAALADFGAGCGEWLQWAMGFDPQLGQTPRWELAVRAAKELHVPRLRLTLAQAGKLSGVLGVTHVAVGTITGTGAKCSLTYALYAVPSQKAVGAPIKLSGTEDQIATELPAAARGLLAGLGVSAPHVPANVGASAADLAVIGRYNWYDSQTPRTAGQPAIDALAGKVPLCALLSFVHQSQVYGAPSAAAARGLLDQASGNFLMLGVLLTFYTHPPEPFGRLVDRDITAIATPRNSVLAYRAADQAQSLTQQVTADLQIARLAPKCPTAWNVLAHAYEDLGDSIRQGRVAASISQQEFATLGAIYVNWMHAAGRAIALDPDYGPAWRELAVAATFVGDQGRADSAFWKAFSLEKGDITLYNWGLEMYQQKWGGDPATLAKVARLAVEAHFAPNADIYGLGKELSSAGFPAESKTMIGRAIAQTRALVSRNPGDGGIHATLGYYLFEQHQEVEAAAELLTAIRLDPNSDIGHYQLGQLYEGQSRYSEAVRQFRESVRITNGINARNWLAAALSNAGQLDEAEQLLRGVIKEQPNIYSSYKELGWVLRRKKQYDDAIAAYKEAERIAPDSFEPHRDLGLMYQDMGKYAEAVEEGEIAVRMSPQGLKCAAGLARAYDMKKDYDSAIPMYLRAIEIDPKDAETHFHLGSLYVEMGKKDQGRAELKRAIELNNDAEVTKSAQEELDKNP